MSVFKRPLEIGEVLEDNRFVSLNTNEPTLGAVEIVKEVVAPKAAKKEKEVAVETPVEAEEVIDEKPLDMVVG